MSNQEMQEILERQRIDNKDMESKVRMQQSEAT